ncbi:MAG: hypothetical protein R6U89_10930 [Dehalococcoidia bacterium]
MSYSLELHDEQSYVYVTISGTTNHENGFEITDSVVRALGEYETDRTLIDLRNIDSKMGLSQAYELVSVYSKLAPGKDIKTAVVEFSDDHNYISSYELASGKNGYRISFFTDFGEAVNWLLI